ADPGRAYTTGNPGRATHAGVGAVPPAEAVRGRVRVVIGLHPDDASADTVEQEGGSDQVRRHRMHAPRKERAPDQTHGFAIVSVLTAQHRSGVWHTSAISVAFLQRVYNICETPR